MEVKDKTDFADRTLVCADCGSEFTFSSGEQMFFHGKGLAEPKRCKVCRRIRRQSLVNFWRENDANEPTS